MNVLRLFQELPDDPYLYYPPESKEWKFVLQAHVRGKSVHGDLRLQITKNLLIGWTLDWIKGIKRQPRSLEDCRSIIDKRLPEAFRVLLDPHKKVVCQKKSPEPSEWLYVDAHFPPGTVGATRFTDGYMVIVDKGTVEFLTQEPQFHEYWFHGQHLKNRFTVRQLPNVWHKKAIDKGEVDLTGRGFSVWMASFTKEPMPYVLSIRAVEKKWYPPAGFSCVPKFIRNQIPKDHQYWKVKDQKKAHSVRDKLAQAIHIKEIVLKWEK